jgi:hypothetical protein
MVLTPPEMLWAWTTVPLTSPTVLTTGPETVFEQAAQFGSPFVLDLGGRALVAGEFVAGLLQFGLDGLAVVAEQGGHPLPHRLPGCAGHGLDQGRGPGRHQFTAVHPLRTPSCIRLCAAMLSMRSCPGGGNFTLAIPVPLRHPLCRIRRPLPHRTF